MPKIRTYTNQVEGFQASNAAASAMASAGEAISRSMNAIGQNIGGGLEDLGKTLTAHAEQQETTDLAAKFATAQAQLSVGWDKTAQSADPNDTELASGYMDKAVNPMIDAIGENVSTKAGRAFYTEMSAKVRASMFEKTATGQAEIAGKQAVANVTTAGNMLSTSAYNDPSNTMTNIGMANATVDALVKSHGLPADQAGKLRNDMLESIASSAVKGIAEKNPDAAVELLDKGTLSQYLDGDKTATLKAYSIQMKNAQTNAQKAATAAQEKADKDKFNATVTDATTTLINPTDGSLQVSPAYFQTIAKAGNMPGADPGAVRAAIDMGRAITADQEKGTPVTTDPALYDDFKNRAFLPDTDPRKLSTTQVLQARASRQLSDKDYAFYYRAVTEKDPTKNAEQKHFDDFTKAYKGYITDSSFLKVNAYGDQRYYEFQTNAQMIHDQMKAAGKSDQDIQKAVVATLPKYQLSSKQATQATMDKATTGLQPLAPIAPSGASARLPGESAADFLKRSQ